MGRVWWLSGILAFVAGAAFLQYCPKLRHSHTPSTINAPKFIESSAAAPAKPPKADRTIFYQQARKNPLVQAQFVREFASLDDRVHIPDHVTVEFLNKERLQTMPKRFFREGLVATLEATHEKDRDTKLGKKIDLTLYFLPLLFTDVNTQNEYDVASWFHHELDHVEQYCVDLHGMPWDRVATYLKNTEEETLQTLVETASNYVEIQHPDFSSCSSQYRETRFQWYYYHYANLLTLVTDEGLEALGAKLFTICAFGATPYLDFTLPGRGRHTYEVLLDPACIVADGEERLLPPSVAPQLEYLRDLK
ncbi:MAG: hypothetical protein QF486_03795 [Candidatus Woesearchaeota archaeon]|jgi:hypothetical protein|nr:hypothetical protein [Candidatus Woesearchaeota archaeon]MDP7181630.1 hypothetical protein [Candidatus Woesearchaeota archaeon]MDP7198719.1 hypothetical protein [Candidatus Woesearchaeota archaeon]MDP7467281.1 hypothetical protein [Candidatus Woesearchaeota archaeon]MDP7647384.1 hypothetical protein [Candidatus Woesearchaeota archaeon]